MTNLERVALAGLALCLLGISACSDSISVESEEASSLLPAATIARLAERSGPHREVRQRPDRFSDQERRVCY